MSINSSSNEESRYEDLLVTPHVGHKKVLVTGGAGFVGSSVAEALLARGDNVVIVDEMNDYYDVTKKESNLTRLHDLYPEEGRLVIYRANICDMSLMTTIFENERPQWVCHMAARAGVRPSIDDPFIYIQSNIVGTTLLMELAHKYKIQNFVFASSSSVYGGSKSAYFSEDENVDNPVSPYAATKKACELLAYTYHHLYQLNVSALRFFTVYGPRGRPDMAPYQFVDKISRGVEIQKFGDGSSSRDYTYISDIVDGVIRSIDRPYPYQVFNIGKGDGTSLNDFIGIVEKHTGKIAKIRQLPNQAGDVPYTCASVEKARALLGYEATVPFDEGIGRTVEWYNSQRIAEAVSVLVATVGTEKTHVTYVLGSSIGRSIINQPSTAPISTSQFGETLMNKCGLSRVVSGNELAHHRAAKRMKVS
jgi:UDP-glucuronate 4-epimerase